MTQEEKDLMEIGELLHEAARRIFVYCEAESDFCIQSVQGTSVVFGGWNRLMWNPNIMVKPGNVINGFFISRSHCTQKFINKFDELYKLTHS